MSTADTEIMQTLFSNIMDLQREYVGIPHLRVYTLHSNIKCALLVYNIVVLPNKIPPPPWSDLQWI